MIRGQLLITTAPAPRAFFERVKKWRLMGVPVGGWVLVPDFTLGDVFGSTPPDNNSAALAFMDFLHPG